ncbi:MAG: hypothetical protein Q4D23_03195 [Bacteroidales bacterium]|nr:hypothetical protein [Bacteroidales bacterium]
MNDIQRLIDRYLAEGLSSDELARLSRAVHRDDAPEDWLVIREMLDTLSEGEDDYDLMLAARTSAVLASAPAARMQRIWKGWRIAASVLLVAAIGATLYFTHNSEPAVANAKKDSVSAPAQCAKTVEALTVAEASNTLETSAPSTVSAKKKLAAETRPASRRSRIAAPAPDVSEIAETNDVPAETYDVPERRIYSCNLLDQVPDNYDAPPSATDGY